MNIEDVVNEYRVGNTTIQKLSKKYGKSPKIISDLLKSNGVSIRSSAIFYKLCEHFLGSKFNAPKEIKIAKTLILKYGEEFMFGVKLDFPIPSLAWFIGDKGQVFLSRELELKKMGAVVKKQEEVRHDTPKLDEKPVEDFSQYVSAKPKSLLEFLNFNK